MNHAISTSFQSCRFAIDEDWLRAHARIGQPRRGLGPSGAAERHGREREQESSSPGIDGDTQSHSVRASENHASAIGAESSAGRRATLAHGDAGVINSPGVDVDSTGDKARRARSPRESKL
jgi:hypothetical protein